MNTQASFRALLSTLGLLVALLAGSGVARATPDELRPILTSLLRTYEGCIVEKYETPQTANVTRRDAATCLLGNVCTRAQRESAYAALATQASAGDDRYFSDQLQRAMLNDCMLCQKHGKWHTKHVHCTMECGGNDDFRDGWRPGKGGCFEGCKAGVDITKWLTQIGRDIAQALGAVKPAEPAERLGGATVSGNYRSIESPPDEICTPPVIARDYFSTLAPASLLDWTPSQTPAFRLTLSGPLKGLLLAAAGVGGALLGGALGMVPFLAPLVSAGFAGGLTAIATGGVPSAAVGLPEGAPVTSSARRNQPEGMNLGAHEGRLIPVLRAAARAADPLASLCKAAEELALKREELGRAFADLAVTGRRSFARFRTLLPQEAQVVACLKARGSAAVRALPATALQAAAVIALDRAYAVSRVLRVGGWPRACPERSKLRWIAVSGEDDQPHRPVNVPSGAFPQYDLAVTVNGKVTVNTRYLIAHSTPPVAAPSCQGAIARSRSLPAEPAPVLAKDAEVLLYVHGMDSRAEEALDLAAALKQVSDATQKNWTVVSVDLPASGYADNLSHETQVSPISRLGEAKFRLYGIADLELTDLQVFNARGKQDVPLLDFLEDFVVAFVERLDKLVPIKARLRAVVGGSLGGNLSLRLGRRPGVPWLKSVVPWSPAAIWPSFADGANPGNHLGVAMPFLWGGGDPRVSEETPARRREFFYKGFEWRAGLLNRKPQPEEWYRDKWGCKAGHLIGARLDRQETYDKNFRLWHWRLAAEQLIYSHQGVEGRNPPYLLNTKPALLLCGYEDTGGDLCAQTRKVAPLMTRTPGKAMFLKNTGHSLHNERPCWLAQHIVEFLGAPVGVCK